MNLDEFSDWNNPEYVESCNSIISHGNCKDVEFCVKCPFHWYNLTKEFADCTEYSDTNDCILKDDKLVQSAKEFLELVGFQKRVEFTATAKSMIDENEYMKFSKIMNPDEYIILDQNNCICSEVNTLKLAEEFVNNSLQKDSDNIFTIYKKIKTGKAKIDVETEWVE
jgi:hypothetical protein